MYRILFAGAALASLITLLASAQTATPLHARKLIVIGIDGLDARFLDNPALHVKTPNIRKLMREGVVATVSGVAPSDSWPAAASLVTGVTPAEHGILSDGGRGFRSQTLWDAALKAGRKTALVYWPAVASTDAPFVFPGHAEMRASRAVPFADVAGQSNPRGLADRIDETSSGFAKELWDDTSSAQAALYLLEREKPDLLMAYMADVDAEQHETTALSIYAREMLENDDDLVGQIAGKMPAGTLIAIVSGHGFENDNFVVRPKVLLAQRGVKGPVDVADGLIGTTDAGVAAALRKLLADGKPHGIAREVPMAEVRAKDGLRGKWVAAFDTSANTLASDEDRGPALGPGTHLGINGLWPSRPNYRAVMILAGAGIKPRRLGEIDMLQIAPTLADAMGVKLTGAKKASLWPSISK